MEKFSNWCISFNTKPKNKNSGVTEYLAEYKGKDIYKKVVFTEGDQHDEKNSLKPGTKAWLSKIFFGNNITN